MPFPYELLSDHAAPILCFFKVRFIMLVKNKHRRFKYVSNFYTMYHDRKSLKFKKCLNTNTASRNARIKGSVYESTANPIYVLAIETLLNSIELLTIRLEDLID